MTEFAKIMLMTVFGAVVGIVIFYLITINSFERKKEKKIGEGEEKAKDLVNEGRSKLEVEKKKAMQEAMKEISERTGKLNVRKNAVAEREAKIQNYLDEINKVHKCNQALRKSNDTFRKIVRDKNMTYLKTIAKNTNMNKGRLNHKIKLIAKILLAADYILEENKKECDNDPHLGSGIPG